MPRTHYSPSLGGSRALHRTFNVESESRACDSSSKRRPTFELVQRVEQINSACGAIHRNAVAWRARSHRLVVKTCLNLGRGSFIVTTMRGAQSAFAFASRCAAMRINAATEHRVTCLVRTTCFCAAMIAWRDRRTTSESRFALHDARAISVKSQTAVRPSSLLLRINSNGVRPCAGDPCRRWQS